MTRDTLQQALLYFSSCVHGRGKTYYSNGGRRQSVFEGKTQQVQVRLYSTETEPVSNRIATKQTLGRNDNKERIIKKYTSKFKIKLLTYHGRMCHIPGTRYSRLSYQTFARET